MFWTMISAYDLDDFTHCLLPGKSIDCVIWYLGFTCVHFKHQGRSGASRCLISISWFKKNFKNQIH